MTADKGQEGLFERFGRAFAAGDGGVPRGGSGQRSSTSSSRGRVQLSRHMRGRETHLATLAAGEFFGEMAIVNNKPRSATATIVDEARMLVLDARTFEAMVRGNAEIALRLIKKLAARLDAANQQVERLRCRTSTTGWCTTCGGWRPTPDRPTARSVVVETNLDELSEHLDADSRDVQKVLERLEQAKLVTLAEHGLEIAAVGKLDQFLSFLDMKERFGAK